MKAGSVLSNKSSQQKKRLRNISRNQEIHTESLLTPQSDTQFNNFKSMSRNFKKNQRMIKIF